MELFSFRTGGLAVASSLLFALAGCGIGGGNGACLKECESASDCARQGTTAADWQCQSGTCQPRECRNDADCPPAGWRQQGCSGGDCPDGYACVEHDEQTHCAPRPTNAQCPDGSPIDKKPENGQQAVSVCLRPTVCSQRQCQPKDARDCSDEDVSCANGATCRNGDCVCRRGDCADGFRCASR